MLSRKLMGRALPRPSVRDLHRDFRNCSPLLSPHIGNSKLMSLFT